MDGDPRDEPTREPTSPEPDAGPLQSDEAAADEAAADEAAADEAAERPEDEPWPRLRRGLVLAAWCLALAGGGLAAAAVGAAGLRLPAPPALDQTLEQASPSGL